MNCYILTANEVFTFIILYYHWSMLIKTVRLFMLLRSSILIPIRWMRKNKLINKGEKKKS